MTNSTIDIIRKRIIVTGAVQGVGFRPFIWRLANSMALSGWVSNADDGARIEVEGSISLIEGFLLRLPVEKPAHARINAIQSETITCIGDTRFLIRQSETEGEVHTLVVPDLAVCEDCAHELHDPSDRRYRYPFINCTNCGPRFSIIEGVPYDRPRTTMKNFQMCPQCQTEYDNPTDRRFHAQPIACPVCGPQVSLLDANGAHLSVGDQALRAAEDLIRAGQIVAVKGLGGFHLIVDAYNEFAVQRLRKQKRREEKPLAVMFPDLESIRRVCTVSEDEINLLQSCEAPIVLLHRRQSTDADPRNLATSVAPGNPYLGAMLPYTPLHHLLLKDLGFAVVATSGNISDEPICIDNDEAITRLKGIADAFLVHNRPIARQVDDSVVRVMAGKPYFIRRARGFAPLPVPVNESLPPVLAVGAHQKNTVAIPAHGGVLVSQHIGDLETVEATAAFRRVITDLCDFHHHQPAGVVCDLHPDYLSTQYAQSLGLPLTKVQHHAAHVISCIAENQIASPVLGVAWDGSGLGTDGTIWGGEFITIDQNSWRRVAALRPFGLPGGNKAIKESRRSALGVLFEIIGPGLFKRKDIRTFDKFTMLELSGLQKALTQKINTPRTSSIGRLFDAVASLCDIRQTCSFEGQAAMELEFTADEKSDGRPYSFEIVNDPACLVVDWEPMIREVLIDVEHAVDTADISARFHATLAEAIVAVANRVGIKQVALSGGCFQNKLLTELAVRRLNDTGFLPILHRQLPPNDGGISFGQLIAAAQGIREEK